VFVQLLLALHVLPPAALYHYVKRCFQELFFGLNNCPLQYKLPQEQKGLGKIKIFFRREWILKISSLHVNQLADDEKP
jgi:hypothetical protein